MQANRLPSVALLVASAGLLLAGCSGTMPSFPSFPSFGGSTAEPPPVAPSPVLPPAFPAQDIVGRWGLAAYHKDEDRERTELAAQSQCRQPYIIGAGSSGGVIMHLADQATPEELRLKGGPGGKTYIGPNDGEAGGQQDREVVSFNGRVLILRWMDSEVQGRYGTMVYVRCPAEGAKPPPKKKPAAKPKPAAPKPQ